MHQARATHVSENHNSSQIPFGQLEPLLLSVDEAARLLNVASRTVWTLTKSGTLPHVRIGRRVLYPVDALRRWTIEQTNGGASHS